MNILGNEALKNMGNIFGGLFGSSPAQAGQTAVAGSNQTSSPQQKSANGTTPTFLASAALPNGAGGSVANAGGKTLLGQ